MIEFNNGNIDICSIGKSSWNNLSKITGNLFSKIFCSFFFSWCQNQEANKPIPELWQGTKINIRKIHPSKQWKKNYSTFGLFIKWQTVKTWNFLSALSRKKYKYNIFYSQKNCLWCMIIDKTTFSKAYGFVLWKIKNIENYILNEKN